MAKAKSKHGSAEIHSFCMRFFLGDGSTQSTKVEENTFKRGCTGAERFPLHKDATTLKIDEKVQHCVGHLDASQSLRQGNCES